MDIPWKDLETTTEHSLISRTRPFALAPAVPKALLVWIGDRQGLIPASQVLGVGRIRPVDWMRLQVRLQKAVFRLVDVREKVQVPGGPGSYFVALRSGVAHAIDGLGGFVDYEPASLRPYVMRARGGAILGRVNTTGARGGEAELLNL